MTCFEDLSMELLMEMYNYLTFNELLNAFVGLQQRLNNTIENYPACIHLSKVINQTESQSRSFRCRSLILSARDLQAFQTKYSHLNFSSLRGVKFIKMNLLTLHSFIELLPIHQLESMIIGRFTWQYYPRDLYRQVWSIIMDAVKGNRLRYLHLPYHVRYWNLEKLPDDFIALRRVTLEYISVSQMLTFIRHAPNLRRLKTSLISPHKDLFQCPVSLSQLNRLTLNLHERWSLEEIEQLFIICPYLKDLILRLEVHDDSMMIMQPNTWQRLIDGKLPHLIFLRLRLNCIVVHPDMKDYRWENKFNCNEYWLQRQPHFQVIIKEIRRGLL